jgi:hypothetical protein
MRSASLLALVLVLSGCAAGLTLEQRSVLACEAWATAFEKATLRREMGLATATEIETVNQTRTVMNPVCLSPSMTFESKNSLSWVEGSLLALIAERSRP